MVISIHSKPMEDTKQITKQLYKIKAFNKLDDSQKIYQILYSCSSNLETTEYFDINDQQIHLVSNATKEIKESKKSRAQYIQISSFDSKLILAAQTRIAVVDIDQKTQHIFTLSDFSDERLPVEFSLWVDSETILFGNVQGIFLWKYNLSDPLLLFSVPNAQNYRIYYISHNNSLDSIVVCLKNLSTNRTCAYFWVKESEAGQLIDHDIVIVHDSIGYSDCDILMSIRKISNKILIVLRSRKRLGGSVAQLNIDKELSLSKSNDTPLMIIKCHRFPLIYLITELGEVFVADLHLRNFFYSYQLDIQNRLIKIVPNSLGEGFIGFTLDGEIISSYLDENFVEQQFKNSIKDKDYLSNILKVSKFTKNAFNEYLEQIDSLVRSKKYDEALNLIYHSNDGVLRKKFVLMHYSKAVNFNQPLLTNYLKLVRSNDSLNYEESQWIVELSKSKPIFIKIIQKLLEEDKFFCSEEFGDLIIMENEDQLDVAQSIYIRSCSHFKVCGCLAFKEDYEQLKNYISLTLKSIDCLTEILIYLRSFHLKMFRNLLEYYFEEKKENYLMPISSEIIFEFNELFTAICDSKYFADVFEVIKKYCIDSNGTLPIDHEKFLETMLEKNPSALVKILNQYHNFDDAKIKLSKFKGEDFELLCVADFTSIKQYVSKSKKIRNSKLFIAVISYFSDEEVTNLIEIILLKDYLELIENIISTLYDRIIWNLLISIFRNQNLISILYDFLQNIVFNLDDGQCNKDLCHAFIELSYELNEISNIEKLIDSAILIDHSTFKSLVILHKPLNCQLYGKYCEKMGLFDDLVKTLISQNQSNYLEYYASIIEPYKFPDIICAMAKSNYFNDSVLQNIIRSFDKNFNIVSLYLKLDDMNKLSILIPTLENLSHQESLSDPEYHTVLAMYYVMQNNDAEKYLKSDKLYNPEIVGDYCCKFDHKFALIAYQHGDLDYKIFELASATQDHDILIDFCFKKNKLEMWDRCFKKFFRYTDENSQLINQPSQNIFWQSLMNYVQKSKNLNSFKTIITYIEDLDEPKLLFDFLHQSLVESGNTNFDNFKEYQTKLIKCAIKIDPSRLVNYFNIFPNLDTNSIGPELIKEKLFEDAICMFSIANKEFEMVKVIIDNLNDIDRALQVSGSITDNKALLSIADALLEKEMLEQAVAIYCQIECFNRYKDVISIGMTLSSYLPLFEFLSGARNKISDGIIDSYCVVCLAMMGNEFELTNLINNYQYCDVALTARICYDHGNIKAAEILFERAGDNAMLSEIYLSKSDLSKAIQYADKASKIELYNKILLFAVEHNENNHIRYLASKCFMHYNQDQMSEIIDVFVKNGKQLMLCTCLEEVAANNSAHSKIYQHFLICLAKYDKSKLETALLMYYSKLNSKIEVLRTCLKCGCYKEAALLEELFGNPDAAIVIMLDYPHQAWNHSKLLHLAHHFTSNLTIKYIIDFYCKYKPKNIPEVYQVLLEKSSHSYLLEILGENKIFVIDLLETQYSMSDNSSINDALILFYIEYGFSKKLKTLYKENKNFTSSLIKESISTSFDKDLEEIKCISLIKTKKFLNAFDIVKTNNLLNQICDIFKECKDIKLQIDILQWLMKEKHISLFICASLISLKEIPLSQFKLISWKYSCYSLIEPIEIMKVKSTEDELNVMQNKLEDTLQKNSNLNRKVFDSSVNEKVSQLKYVLDK